MFLLYLFYFIDLFTSPWWLLRQKRSNLPVSLVAHPQYPQRPTMLSLTLLRLVWVSSIWKLCQVKKVAAVALHFIGELFESRTPLVLVGSCTCFVIRRFERVVHWNTIHMFVNTEDEYVWAVMVVCDGEAGSSTPENWRVTSLALRRSRLPKLRLALTITLL